MFNMLLGCVTPGGVGAGLYGFLVLAVIAVFVAGLMVGRTPEYLGKKIETREMKLAMLAVLIYPSNVLGFTATSLMLKTLLDSLNNAGSHGLSEVLYAFASTNGNNGSAFAGLNGNTLWFNTTLGLAMFIGRFAYVIPVLALAGSFAAKKKAPASAGTFPTHGPLFVGLLLGVILILSSSNTSRLSLSVPWSSTSCWKPARSSERSLPCPRKLPLPASSIRPSSAAQ
jgi:potassium-transporting ATPase potassium-binding subunit